MVFALTRKSIARVDGQQGGAHAGKYSTRCAAGNYDAGRMSLPVNHEGVESNGAKDAVLRPRGLVSAGLLTAALLCVRLWRLDGSCLWFDEVFSVHAARHGWRALLDFIALDLIHPPLFYLLLKSWIALVGNEATWWLRLFSVLTATAAVVPVMLLCRELRLRPVVAQLALVLMVASGFLIQHAREVRMYSLLLLLAACSLWLFASYSQAARRKRHVLAALFAVNLLLVYTHYYGWLLVGHELIFLALWRRRKAREFALLSAALVVCYSPWLLMLWQASTRAAHGASPLLAQNIGWAVPPRPADILQPFLVLHEPFRFRQNTHEPAVLPINVWLALALFIPAFIAAGRRAVMWPRRVAARKHRADAQTRRADAQTRRAAERALETETEQTPDVARGADERFALTFLTFFSTAPVVVAFLLARVLPHSIWGTRHLTIIAPAYLLLAACALSALRPHWLATTLKLLLACWLTLAAMLWLMRPNDAPPIWCAWETLARRVVEREASGTNQVNGEVKSEVKGEVKSDVKSEVKIYATEDLVAYHLWYALSTAPERRFRVATLTNLPGLPEDKAFFLPRGFDEVTATSVGTDGDGGNNSGSSNSGDAFREEHFWVAFRDTSWNPQHPLLRLLSERGYDIQERFELTASGQKAFIISARRHER